MGGERGPRRKSMDDRLAERMQRQSPAVEADPRGVPRPVLREAAPDNDVPVEAQVEIENDGETLGVYERLHEDWEKKNAYVRETEAYQAFAQEGGQELVTIFGAEKVGAAVERLLKDPNKALDERTGLYLLVKELEPNENKRSALYKKMAKAADAEAEAYEVGLRAQKTNADRDAYITLNGGKDAPTRERALLRKLRIAEYRAYDRAAYSVIGGLTQMMERAWGGKREERKWSLAGLKNRFSQEAFTRGVSEHKGSLAQWMGLRSEWIARREQKLEAQRVAGMDALNKTFEARMAAVRAPFRRKMEETLAAFDRAFPDGTVPELMTVVEKQFEEIAAGIELAERQAVDRTLHPYVSQLDELMKINVFEDR